MAKKEETTPPPPATGENEPPEGEQLTRGDIEDVVRDVLNKVLPDALKGATTPPPAGEPPPVVKRESQADSEDRVRQLVADQVAEIKKGDEIVGRIGKIEEKLVEAPPAPVRRLTKAMWS